MDLQHVHAKLFVQNPETVDSAQMIPIFHSWIQDRTCEELLLDVADYRHVPGGPGVILIGHEANYSLDNTNHRLGVRYSRKAPLDGSAQDRLEQALRAALLACRRLEGDPRLSGNLRFNGREMELTVNDRLIAPNVGATRSALEPEIRALCNQLLAGQDYSLCYEADPRRLFSVTVNSSRAFAVPDLLNNLLS
ncbi:MAG: hypothetical protein ACM3NO_01110 [Deltaproteobacteria bacterium]